MTFNRLVIRMFKVNFAKYLLYFLCSCFTIMMFFTFLTLYANPDFRNPTKVDPMVYSNIRAPLVILAAFSILFIAYAQTAFIAFRKKELGTLMVLGLTEGNMRRLLALEQGIIGGGSIAVGLGAGTAFAPAFFQLVLVVAGLKDISFFLTAESYGYTLLFFAIVYAVLIGGSVISSFRYKLLELLKGARLADRSWFQGSWAGWLGILLLAIGAWDMLAHYDPNHSTLIFRSLVIAAAGIYLIFGGAGAWIIAASSASRRYHQNLLFCSDLKYSLGQARKVMFLITVLVAITCFLTSLTFYMREDALDSAVRSTPFHIAYAEAHGKNALSPKEIGEIAALSQTPLVSHQTIPYLDFFFPKVLSEASVNAAFGTSYEVRPGHFLQLSLIVPDDGYNHDLSEVKAFPITTADGERTFISQGAVAGMLWNRIPFVGERLFILNEEDFRQLEGASKERSGYLHLLNFQDWKQTGDVDDKLNAALGRYNQDHTPLLYDTREQEAGIFKTSSRIGQYTQNLESGNFVFFLMAFVGLLFYICSGVILHFKIWTELDREIIKFRKLHRIGITAKEAERLVAQSLRLLFFLPVAAGLALSVFYYSATMAFELNRLSKPLLQALGISGCYLAAQALFYAVYKRGYARTLLARMYR